MSESKYVYRCTKCGKLKKYTDDEHVPVCCEKEMVKQLLDQCTIADHPEMVRNSDTGEPCDDGRGKESTEED